ncbi:MAG: 3-isopropylmalate dehydratase [Desulfobacterales bacterium]|nr:3-isopropylmalate dehydratase [Desulfobacterales bacterium]
MTNVFPLRSIQGRVWKLGDHVDTDVIYPGKYLSVIDPRETARYALTGLDPTFPSRVKAGDIIVAGRNFGCGSSRSQAVTCLKYLGIGAVVAASIGRIFFRNAINQGLTVIECAQAEAVVEEGERIEILPREGILHTRQQALKFTPLPDFLMEIVVAGGLLAYTKKALAQQR